MCAPAGLDVVHAAPQVDHEEAQDAHKAPTSGPHECVRMAWTRKAVLSDVEGGCGEGVQAAGQQGVGQADLCGVWIKGFELSVCD